MTHPAVADAGVVGRPDPQAGELPTAWIVLKPTHKNTTEQDIKAFVKGQEILKYLEISFAKTKLNIIIFVKVRKYVHLF